MDDRRPTVFVDMDGVLADLFNHMADLQDVDHYNDMSKAEWERFFATTDAYHLFRNIPPFPTANALVQMVRDLFGGYMILSSPLSHDRENSIAGKKDWLQANITVPADGWVFEHDKFKYARQPNGTPNILIDDWNKNIIPWREHGGIGIKYQGDEDSLGDLRRQLEEVRAIFR
jgi:5'(3')-deoxyribonucleotidase